MKHHSQPKTTSSPWGVAIQWFVLLFFTFLLHRMLSLEFLIQGVPKADVTVWKALTVGLLSDYWVAVLLSTVILLWMFPYHALKKCVTRKEWPAIGLFGFALILGVLAAAHQSYVEFFKFPIALFHLRYLYDSSFLAANTSSLWSLKSIVLAMSPLGIVLMTRGFLGAPFRQFRRASAGRIFIVLVVLGLFFHNRNIHYREQWFIPESLQVNPLERIYMQVTSNRHPKDLTLEEMHKLEQLIGHSSMSSSKITRDRLLQALTRPYPQSDQLVEPAITLRRIFEKRVAEGKHPIVAVILMESLRPSETGYFHPPKSVQKSLTPRIDDEVQRSIVFPSAFSTGSVTRGAQEAVLCGSLGSRDTSMMRGTTLNSFDCLTQMVSMEADTFWYHGGDLRFDQQGAFWKNQGVKDILSLQDFPEGASRTSWGIGDQTFFQSALDRLKKLRRNSQSRYLLGMILSLSNHVPWSLPTDYPRNSNIDKIRGHSSYATTAYSDSAFGDFIRGLKLNNMWQDSLIVVNSDHGNDVPPWHQLYSDSSHPKALLASHVNLFLIGGVVEEALSSLGIKSLTVPQTVSQVDISVFLADLLRIKNRRFFGENLFQDRRTLPVISILEEDLFSPATGEMWSRKILGDGVTSPGQEESIKAQLYYRAYMQLMAMPRPRV